MRQATEAVSQLRAVKCTLGADERFPMPASDGYSVYGALLSVLDEVDTDVSASVHDSPMGSLHSSGLVGSFGSSDRPHHKTVLPGEEYQLSLGIVHPEDTGVFQALVNGLVLEGETIELSHGELRVERFESESATYAELLDRASTYDDPTIEMEFRTPTCIEEAGEVTTLVPYRWSVVNSIMGKWNQSCPVDLELELDREAVLESVIEKPDPRSFDTHSVLVNRVENEDGENRNIFRQGFSGRCEYAFKSASESVVNAVTALALFGEYSGVGSAVARGCGTMEVTVE